MSVFMFDDAPDAEKAAYLAGRKDGLLAAAAMDACKGGECHGMACSSCLRDALRAAAEEVGK